MMLVTPFVLWGAAPTAQTFFTHACAHYLYTTATTIGPSSTKIGDKFYTGKVDGV